MRSDLPTGTVTFLFTDVEGSTKLLHKLGAEAYAAALAEHRNVIREACSRQDGVEVDTQGDAFFFAFPTAPGALAAAQRTTEMLAEGPIQVRVGLHTGTPLVTEEGYVGDDVHYAARVAASGHGGQITLSSSTAALIEPSGSEPQALPLLDLGEHRLKDIPDAVAIFQFGEGSFPPLKTISNTNLPRPASSFVGREAELAEVLGRIEQGARLVTLTGPGGSGKTRLALEAAASLVPEYKAGVFWVGLASLRDPALVTETIAQTLGAKDGLAAHIGEREFLLLLDNLEQVVECAPELSELLEAGTNLTLLCTSRELMRIQGEVEYAVPPLAEPEAVALFCERAQLEPSEEIAELCARLDSLPLAVELAAARTKALSPAQILERLAQRLDLLKGGRDADPRQQTLRATIEWSYDLLSEEEQQLFARLSVFASGCTLEAAEEIADADLDTLQSLVEKSLLRFTTERYWMLQTIGEYAAARLGGTAEVKEIRQRHAHFVLSLAEGAEDGLNGADGTTWLDQLEREKDNLRAALEWMEQTGQHGSQLEVIGHTWPFWRARGRSSEGRRWADAALAGSDERSVRRAKALRAAAGFSLELGDVDALRTYTAEALSIFQEVDDLEGVTTMLIGLGIVAEELGDFAEARRMFEDAAAIASAAGNRRHIAYVSGNLAYLASRQTDHARAVTAAEDARTLFRDLGLEEDQGWASYLLAYSLFALECHADAVRAARESVTLSSKVGDVSNLVPEFILIGALAAHGDAARVGAKLLGAAEALREQSGAALPGGEADLYQETVEALSRMLTQPAWDEAFAEGKAMSIEQAFEFALSSLD